MPRILFVSGFNPSTRARELAMEFERYGQLVRCDVPAPRDPRATYTPYAFIEFRSSRDAEDAYHEMHGQYFQNHRLSIQWAKSPPSSGWRSDRAPPRRDRERSRSPRRRTERDERDRDRDRDRDRERNDDRYRDRDKYDDRHRDRDRGDRRERERAGERERDRDRDREVERRRSRSPSPRRTPSPDRRRERERESRVNDRDRARTPPMNEGLKYRNEKGGGTPTY